MVALKMAIAEADVVTTAGWSLLMKVKTCATSIQLRMRKENCLECQITYFISSYDFQRWNTADVLIIVFQTNGVLVQGFLYSVLDSVIVMNHSKMECQQYHGTKTIWERCRSLYLMIFARWQRQLQRKPEYWLLVTVLSSLRIWRCIMSASTSYEECWC